MIDDLFRLKRWRSLHGKVLSMKVYYVYTMKWKAVSCRWYSSVGIRVMCSVWVQTIVRTIFQFFLITGHTVSRSESSHQLLISSNLQTWLPCLNKLPIRALKHWATVGNTHNSAWPHAQLVVVKSHYPWMPGHVRSWGYQQVQYRFQLLVLSFPLKSRPARTEPFPFLCCCGSCCWRVATTHPSGLPAWWCRPSVGQEVPKLIQLMGLSPPGASATIWLTQALQAPQGWSVRGSE